MSIHVSRQRVEGVLKVAIVQRDADTFQGSKINDRYADPDTRRRHALVCRARGSSLRWKDDGGPPQHGDDARDGRDGISDVIGSSLRIIWIGSNSGFDPLS